MSLFYWFLLCITYCFLYIILLFFRHSKHGHGRRKSPVDEPLVVYRFPRKPEWVAREIIRMKALMPQAGCRSIADSFNRQFISKGMSVSKSFVNDTLRRNEYEIQVLRKDLKHRRPKPMPLNRVWAMDLTGKQDTQGNIHSILGLLEHGSRANLCLTALKDKASITLLHHLLDAIEKYGKPAFLRTDNESIFTSRMFRFGLWLLGIRHQKIDKGCPWQNGRVERFFGTLKQKLDQWEVDSFDQMNHALLPFRFWYNFVRPHQNLEGRTPAEMWAGKDIYSAHPKTEEWFEAWDGLLAGYYLRI